MCGVVAVTRRFGGAGAVKRGHRDCDLSAEASVWALVSAHRAAKHARPGACLVTRAAGKSDFWPDVGVVYRLGYVLVLVNCRLEA